MEKAVAVKYDNSLPAPFILAKGKGKIAKKLKKIARDSGVNIAYIPDLADSLIELPAGAFIPEKYYQIIAQLLIFVRDMNKK